MHVQDPLAAELTIENHYLNALRDCCTDDAAFLRMQQILMSMQVEQDETRLAQREGYLRQQMQVLADLAKSEAVNSGDLALAFPYLVKQTAKTLHVERVSLWLYSCDQTQLHCQDLYLLSQDWHQSGLRLTATDCPQLFESLGSARTLVLDQPFCAQWEHGLCHGYFGQHSVTSRLLAIIWLGGQIRGVLGLEHIGSARHWTLEEQNFAGSMADWVAMALEAHERKRTQEQLQASETKFAKAFRANPGAVCLSTLADGRILDVNRSFEQISGYHRDEVIGRTTTELNLWADSRQRDWAVQQLQDHGSIREIEFQFYRKNGASVIGTFSAETVQLDGVPCLLSMVHDITDRKRAEIQLRAAAQRDRLLGQVALRIHQSLDLSQILNTTVIEVRHVLQADLAQICLCDPDTQAWVAADSVSPPWFDKVKSLSILSPEQLERFRPIFAEHPVWVIEDWHCNSKPLPSYWSLDLCCQDLRASITVPIYLGDRFCGLLLVSQCTGPRRWQDFEIQLLEQLATQVGIAIQQATLYRQVQNLNATLESQVEERTAQLQQKMEELTDLNQVKDAFLKAFSHELRTPVMGTLMVLKNLLNQTGSQITLPRTMLERMIQGHERQLNMANALIEAYSEAKTITVKPEPTHLRSLIEDTLKDLDTLLQRYQPIICNEIPSDLPKLALDPLQVKCVYNNLITNALKHNSTEITLTLTATLLHKQVHCEVKDNGIGLNSEQCEHIFELHKQALLRPYTPGLGLGLFLSRQIISAHGGQIGVKSAPGRGACFWFTLPLQVE